MTPAEIAALQAALTLARELLPKFLEYVGKGEISAEKQASVRAEYDSLRTLGGGQFQGNHWKV